MVHKVVVEDSESEDKKRRPRRSRQVLQKAVLDAVSSLVREKGFANITITAVAQKAEVDINAILRYFGSIEKLLDVYSHLFDYWFRNILEDPERLLTDPAGYYRDSVVKLAESFYNSREMQELLIWEVVEDNSTTKMVAANRELSSEPVVTALNKLFKGSGINFDVMAALLIAGIYFLVIRRKRSPFLGVDFSSRKGKARLLETIKQSVDLCFDALDKHNEKLEIARKLKAKGVDVDIISECISLDRTLVSKL